MSNKKRRWHSAEQIVKKLRDADAMIAAGKSIREVQQALEISEATEPVARPVRRNEERRSQEAETARRRERSCRRSSPGHPDAQGDHRGKLTTKKVGFRVIAYGARHSFATNALIKGVDSVTVAHLMGHKDASMVSKVYSHLATNVEFLRQQARTAAGANAKSTKS